MAVTVFAVEPGSAAFDAGLQKDDKLISINGKEIVDVLDYRFYQREETLTLSLEREGKPFDVTVTKPEEEELGLSFETYLMDGQKRCKNNCIFCFIDQLPKGMRESLYFKDDDSRMSFLFGNYITLTNISEHEVNRIIEMHISPVNVSVHTTNPELRVKMMGNRFAGQALDILWKLCDAGIELNTQLVLCPEYNDGEELERSLTELTARKNIRSVAVVPVGLTAYREGLTELRPFTATEAADVLAIAEQFGAKCLAEDGARRVYPADEFFLLAGKPIPDVSYYEDFVQLENGVGMWSMTEEDGKTAIETEKKFLPFRRRVSSVTGEAAYPLIKALADETMAKWKNLNCTVYPIHNDFFGGEITVTGLVTGTDIIRQLKGKDLGSELIVPSVMLRHEGDRFLDDVTVPMLERSLGVKVRVSDTDGAAFIRALLNKK